MRKPSAMIIAAMLLFPTVSSATNGYWAHGYGPKSKSIAGACVAMAFGAMCTASNPGSLVLVGQSDGSGGFPIFTQSRFQCR